MNRLLTVGFLLLVLLLTACSPAPQETPSPSPTPPTILVDITPAARPAAAALTACADVFTGFELQVRERYASQSDAGLLIRLGAPEGSPQPEAGFLAQIATEDVRVILPASGPVSSLTNTEVMAVFSGQMTAWEQENSELPITVWVPLAADETRQAFENVIMAGLPVVSDAQLAPDPAAMLQAVSEDTGAVGFVPAAWETNSDLHSILLGIRMPVLVQADQAPTGQAAELLACMQGPIGQLALLDLYQ